jgi:multicomponent Na+:H+ antiporter subunit F
VKIELAAASFVLPLALALLALAAMLVLVRLLKGPTGADRVVAIDALTLIGVAVVSIAALMTRQGVVLDVALVLALVTFPGTVAFALLFRKHDTPCDNAGVAPGNDVEDRTS